MAFVEDPRPRALDERAYCRQTEICRTIVQENTTVAAAINSVVVKICRKKLQCSDSNYFAITHNRWELFVCHVVEQLLTYGYVLAIIDKIKYQDGLVYLVPDIISADRYALVPDPKTRWKFHFLFDNDSKKKMHVFWKNEPDCWGNLKSDVWRCRYWHEHCSRLVAFNEHAIMLNSRSRGIVVKESTPTVASQYDLLGSNDDTGGIRQNDPYQYYKSNLDTIDKLNTYSYEQAMAAEQSRNFATAVRRGGFAHTSSRSENAPENSTHTTEFDYTLGINTKLTPAPAAVLNPHILQTIEHANNQIRAIFGTTLHNETNNIKSAESLLIQERHLDHVIEPMRIRIDQILKRVSQQMLQSHSKTDAVFAGQGVWLGSPMSESTFERVERFLTPAAKRRHVAQVFNVSTDDIDPNACALPVAENTAQSGISSRVATKKQTVDVQ